MKKGEELERKTLLGVLTIGIVLAFYLFRRKPLKDWLLVFFINSLTNNLIDRYVLRKGYLKYPVKFQNILRSNVAYINFLCPLLEVWYCQATKNDDLKNILRKLPLFVIPQVLFEWWAERKTRLLQFRTWTIFHTIFAVSAVKIGIRFIYGLINRLSRFQNGSTNEKERDSF